MTTSNSPRPSFSPPTPPRTLRNKKRKAEFDIFCDLAPEAAGTGNTKRSRSSQARKPLSQRRDSANSTPGPPVRPDDQPFVFNPQDPFWENKENFDPEYVCTQHEMRTLPTPTPTPTHTPATPPPTNRPSPASPSPAAPPAVQPLPKTRATRILSPPVDMALYDTLEITNWRASKAEIRRAYRKIAIRYHPDKVDEDMREFANAMMQQINAAKDVLLDSRKRRQYHEDGIVP